MPTVLRRAGFRVFFFSNEGEEPPHVHVERAGGVVKVWLSPASVAYYRDPVGASRIDGIHLLGVHSS